MSFINMVQRITSENAKFALKLLFTAHSAHVMPISALCYGDKTPSEMAELSNKKLNKMITQSKIEFTTEILAKSFATSLYTFAMAPIFYHDLYRCRGNYRRVYTPLD